MSVSYTCWPPRNPPRLVPSTCDQRPWRAEILRQRIASEDCAIHGAGAPAETDRQVNALRHSLRSENIIGTRGLGYRIRINLAEMLVAELKPKHDPVSLPRIERPNPASPNSLLLAKSVPVLGVSLGTSWFSDDAIDCPDFWPPHDRHSAAGTRVPPWIRVARSHALILPEVPRGMYRAFLSIAARGRLNSDVFRTEVRRAVETRSA